MTKAAIYAVESWQGNAPIFMARVENYEGERITQASISSIKYSIRDDCDDNKNEVAEGTLDKAVVVFDTLQTDGIWTKNSNDKEGYNFKLVSDPAWFPKGDNDYLIEVIFTPTTGNKFTIKFKNKTKKVHDLND